MSRFVIASVVGCLVTAGGDLRAADAGAKERAFLQALEAFDSAKSPAEYRHAAQMLESIVSDGYRNGAVYYNLGNAWFRAGEYGRAIAAYRKAKPFRPRDRYLEANLKQAVQRAPGRLPESAAPWWSHVLFWQGWLSYPEKAYAAVVASAMAALLMVCAVLWRSTRLRWLSAALGVFAVVMTIDAGFVHREVESNRRGVVTTETIARKGIGESYEPAFDQPLKDGAEFTILMENGDWIFGQFEGIGDGWLKREAVAL